MDHTQHSHSGAFMFEALFGEIQAFAELGWLGVVLAVIIVAWKPTLSYLNDANERRISHTENVIMVMQKELNRMQKRIDELQCEVERWRTLYLEQKEDDNK